MNIWLINHYAIPPGQPGGTRHYDLARELIATGHRPLIIAANFNHWSRKDYHPIANASRRETSEKGVPFLWLATPGYGGNLARLRNMLTFSFRLKTLLAHTPPNKPDIIMGSSPHLFSAFAGCFLAHRLQIPFVLEIRDIWPLSMVEVAGVTPWHPMIAFLSWMEKWLYQHADGIVSLLPGTDRHIAACTTASKPFLWLPNGIDVEKVQPVSAKSQIRPYTILYAGSHGDANHLECILDAADLLKKAEAPVRFEFIGQGPEKPKLMHKARTMQLSNVSFEDPLPKEQIYGRLAKADAFIISLKKTPLYRFGISLNKLFDYMAVGKPVIFAGDAYQNPVALADCGIVTPPENARKLSDGILQLLDMTIEERSAMGRRGRIFVEKTHNTRCLSAQLTQFFESLIRKHAEKAV
jgi:glycosyltransferase involved in cell wall biosynthesis